MSSQEAALNAAEQLLRQGEAEQTLPQLLQYCGKNLCDARAWFLLGVAYHQTKKLENALQAVEHVLMLEPRHLQARSTKGAVLHDLGRLQEAIQVYRKALHLAPGDAQLLVNLAIVMERAGDSLGALERYNLALKHHPEFPSALLNRGSLLLKLGRLHEALDTHHLLTQLQPAWDIAHYNHGESLLALSRWQEALAAYQRALELRPRFAQALFGTALALSMLRRFDEARQALDSAHATDPLVVEFCIRNAALTGANELRQVMPEVIYLLRRAHELGNCDWTNYAEFVADFETLAARPIEHPNALSEPALVYAALSLPLADTTRMTLATNAALATVAALPAPQTPFPYLPGRPGKKLRIGYVSPEFGMHPIGRLTRQLYALHDRSQFEVYGYALQSGDGSAIRREIEQGCDHFRLLAGIDDPAAAALIHADSIDILVNLGGYITHARNGIFALQPAPIQASYNGFPGSIGASFMHYFITDAVCSPPGQETQFTEQLVYLPHSCMIYNNRETISARPVTRARFGLPQQGFVFCCFNNSYKIEPLIFAAWMNILQRTPGSVLWLSGKNEMMAANLRAEAELRGVAGSRLIFADFLPDIAEHLARYRLADLFLDTLHFNAITTAADALWAGLPVLSCPGSTFVSRWASSMLKAVGLDELIADNLDHYQQLACDLASNHGELARLKARLATNRMSRPLFDTQRNVGDIETAYLTMWQRHLSGGRPMSFSVAAGRADA